MIYIYTHTDSFTVSLNLHVSVVNTHFYQSSHSAVAESEQKVMMREVKVFPVQVKRHVHHLVWEES